MPHLARKPRSKQFSLCRKFCQLSHVLTNLSSRKVALQDLQAVRIVLYLQNHFVTSLFQTKVEATYAGK